MKRLLPVFFCLAPILLAACSAAPAFLSAPAPEVGALAPDFTLQTVKGDEISLSDLRGQVVLINFWATWCAPCRLEMPAIQARYNRGGFAVLAVNFDEDPEKVQGFMEKLGLSFPALLDPGGEIQNLYRVRGYPTSFFIDEKGVIQIFHIGQMDEVELDEYLVQMGVQP